MLVALFLGDLTGDGALINSREAGRVRVRLLLMYPSCGSDAAASCAAVDGRSCFDVRRTLTIENSLSEPESVSHSMGRSESCIWLKVST